MKPSEKGLKKCVKHKTDTSVTERHTRIMKNPVVVKKIRRFFCGKKVMMREGCSPARVEKEGNQS